MTNEESNIPSLGEHDWTAMEALANGVDESQIVGGGTPIVITDEMLVKRLLWDVAPHSMVPEVAEYLGLTQTSEDGTDMEHQEAHERMIQTLGVAQEVQIISQVAARTIFATMLVQQGGTEEVVLDSEEFNEHVAKFAQVIFAANLAVLAELVDWDLIHTPRVAVVYVEEEGNSSGE